jgi:hypothetical protein
LLKPRDHHLARRAKCQKECQIEGQIECQTRCQIECQNECQIEGQKIHAKYTSRWDVRNYDRIICHGWNHSKENNSGFLFLRWMTMPLIYHGFSELTMSHFGFNSKVGRHVATISFPCILRMATPFLWFTCLILCCSSWVLLSNSILLVWTHALGFKLVFQTGKHLFLCSMIYWNASCFRKEYSILHIVAIKVDVWRGISELGHGPGVPKQTSTLHGGFDQRIDHLRLPEGLQSAELTGCDVDM